MSEEKILYNLDGTIKDSHAIGRAKAAEEEARLNKRDDKDIEEKPFRLSKRRLDYIRSSSDFGAMYYIYRVVIAEKMRRRRDGRYHKTGEFSRAARRLGIEVTRVRRNYRAVMTWKTLPKWVRDGTRKGEFSVSFRSLETFSQLPQGEKAKVTRMLKTKNYTQLSEVLVMLGHIRMRQNKGIRKTTQVIPGVTRDHYGTIIPEPAVKAFRQVQKMINGSSYLQNLAWQMRNCGEALNCEETAALGKKLADLSQELLGLIPAAIVEGTDEWLRVRDIGIGHGPRLSNEDLRGTAKSGEGREETGSGGGPDGMP